LRILQDRVVSAILTNTHLTLSVVVVVVVVVQATLDSMFAALSACQALHPDDDDDDDDAENGGDDGDFGMMYTADNLPNGKSKPTFLCVCVCVCVCLFLQYCYDDIGETLIRCLMYFYNNSTMNVFL